MILQCTGIVYNVSPSLFSLSLSLVSMWFDSSCPFAKDGRTWWYYVSALLDISRPTYWVEMGWAFMVLILFLLLLLHPSSAISHPVFFVSHCRLPWHLAPSNFQLLCVRSWTTRRRIQGTTPWQPLAALACSLDMSRHVSMLELSTCNSLT